MTGIVGHRGLILKTAAAGGSGSGWNPADKDALITLSSGDLIADGTGSSGAYPGVRSVVGKSVGTLYYEISVGAGYLDANNSLYYAGIGDAACALIGAQPVFNALGGPYAITRLNSQWGTDAGSSGASGPNIPTDGAHTLGFKATFSTRVLTFLLDGSSIGTLTWGSGAASMFPIAYFETASGPTSGLRLRTKSTEFLQSIPVGATAWEP